MMLDWLQDKDPNRENLDPQSREMLARLLNNIEALHKENQELRAENQRLRDQIAQLKGHKGKPDIKPNRPPKSAPSSEQAKGKGNSRNRPPQPPRHRQIKIDREQVVKLDRGQLPRDVTSARLPRSDYPEYCVQN